jgi:hypothetical protein
MGALSVSGRGSEADQPLDDELPGDAAPAEQEAAPEAGEESRTVPASQLLPETAASRRERQWQERVSAHVKPLEERLTAEVQTARQQVEEERRQRQEQATELARMRGMIEAMQRQSQQGQQAQPAVDTKRLFADAKQLLGSGDIDGYHAKLMEANEAIADQKAEARAKVMRDEFQRSQPAQVPPHIQQLIYQSPNVAAAGDKGFRAVIRMEQELEDDGMAQGYARTQKAFQTVNERLGKAKTPTPPARPSYSQDSAAALSAIPTSRGTASGGGNEGDVKLTPAQWAAYKADPSFKSPAEYLKWADPHKHGLVKK